MYLLQLDLSNKVLLSLALTDVTQIPINTPLSASYMLSALPIQPGQIFDPDTQSFSMPARRRWLTKLAFDSRFTMAESVALKQAQVLPSRNSGESDVDYAARCNVPLQLQVMGERRNLASYIDLDRTDTQQMVQSLETMGLLATGRAAQILGDPILDHEYFPEA